MCITSAVYQGTFNAAVLYATPCGAYIFLCGAQTYEPSESRLQEAVRNYRRYDYTPERKCGAAGRAVEAKS